MNARPKVVAGYVLGWWLIACFVVLLTLIFNFLGTIICAALAGMMMGAAKLKKWQSLLMSLLFPAVITTVLRMSRAELSARDICFLSLLCFCLFWLVYAAVFALVSQEQAAGLEKKPAPAGSTAVSANAASGPPTDQSAEPGVQSPESELAAAPPEPALPELTLAQLQGTWIAQVSGGAGPARQRLLEIENTTVVLSLVGENGHAAVLGKAQLTFSDHSVSLRSLTADH